MKLVRNLAALPDELRSGAVAIGNFDGVHLGHARIVGQLIAAARRLGGLATVFTFDPHPVRLLRPASAPPPLTWTARKAQLLEALGVDAVIAYPTDEALLNLSPRAFFDSIIVERLAARAMVEGPNFFFGHNRQGTIDTLRQYTREAGISLEVVEGVSVGGQMVSSSRVRQLLAGGKVDEARHMLTEPYRIRGMVTHGAGRGARLGFPTANVDAIDTLLPAAGVYAGRAVLGAAWGSVASPDAESWPAAINVGPNPTFGEHALKVEVHLLDFDRPLYGEPLEVEFLARLRDIQTFAGPDALHAQLQRDVAAVRHLSDFNPGNQNRGNQNSGNRD